MSGVGNADGVIRIQDGVIAGALGLAASGSVGAYLIAVAGAAVLIGLLKMLGVMK